jgi:hypothetical protein
VSQCVFSARLRADDFLTDAWHLQDGLRTKKWAQTIAGTAATIISGLVNGALIFQKGNYTPTETGEKPASYTMDVRTEDERTSLIADGKDRLWVYAQIICSDPAVDARSLTNGIGFNFSGTYANWVTIKQRQPVGSYNAVLLAAEPPTPEAELPDDTNVTLMVSGATAQGEPINVPVTLSLDGDRVMQVDILG